MTVRGIGALVGEEFYLAGGDRAVFFQPSHDMESDRVTHTVGDEGLFTRAVDTDTASADLRRAPRAERLIQCVLLIAESASDIRFDDTDIAPRSAQCLTDDTPYDMGDLCGCDHDDTAILFISEAAVVLDMAVLDGRGLIPAFDLDEACFLYRALIITDTGHRMLQDIVRELFVQLRRAVLHRFLSVQHKGKLLILYREGAHALYGGDFVIGDDDGNVVAPVADVGVQQLSVRDVLMPRVHRPRVSRGGEGDVRHVKAGQHFDDPGDLHRSGGVDRLDDRVRLLGVLDTRVKRVFRHTVLIVFGPAGRLIVAVYSGFASSDFIHELTLL